MARKRLTSLPEGLWSKLAELEAYVRQLDIVRGCGWTLAVAAISLSLGVLADMTFDLPLSARIGLLVAACLGTLATAYGMLWRPWRRRRSVLDLAAVVERAHPHLQESLVSCIELYDTNIPESERGSALMREMAAKQALQNVRSLDFCAAVSPHPAHRMAIGGLLAWALLLVPVMVPSSYRLLLMRFFSPWQNLDRVASFWFEVDRGDRVVVRGSDVTLAAHPKGSDRQLPATAELHWTNEEGESDSRRIDYDASSGVYATTLPHVMHGFQYYLSGAGNRSRTYRIQVVEAPAITSLKVEIQPPAYTGQPAKLLDGPPTEITVLERSRVRWQLAFNKPLRSAEWQWQADVNPRRPAATDPPLVRGEIASNTGKAVAKASGLPAIPFTLAKDRLSATWDSVPEHGGMFRLVVRDEYGLSNETDVARQLIVTPDTAPILSISGSAGAEIAQASDTIPVNVKATDDVAIGALELHYEIDAARKGVLKCEVKDLGKPQLQHQFNLILPDLQLRNNEVLSYRVRAADERPVPGPNETWSEQRFVRIDPKAKAPGTQELALDHEQLQKFLQQLHQDVTAQKAQTEQLQAHAAESLEKDQKADRQLQQQLEQTADQQAKLQARLEQLAAALAQHPLFSNLAEQTQQLAAAEFAQAQTALSDAEQKQGAERTEKLQAAQTQLAQADEQLGALEQRLEKLAQLERDLLELNRLAAQAEQLAQRLKKTEQQQNAPAPQLETPQERESREQLRKAEENETLAKQQELSRQATEILQKQPELQQAARQNQQDQLAQMLQRVEQLAQPQQALADELLAAAIAKARDNAALATRQEDLKKQIEQLNERLAKQNPLDAQPLDPKAAEKAAKELQAGNLGAAAAEEERLAKRLEELKKKLEADAAKPENPPADQPQDQPQSPVEDAERLSKQARQLQEDLQRAQRSQDLTQQQKKQEQLARMLSELNQQIEQADARLQKSDSATDAKKETPPKEQQPRQQPGSSAAPQDASAKRAPRNQAQAAMDQAQQELQQGNPERSAEAAKQAAEALRQLAQQSETKTAPESAKDQSSSRDQGAEQSSTPAAAEQTATSKPTSPQDLVPKAAAGEITDAVNQLQEALAASPETRAPRQGSTPPAGRPDSTEKATTESRTSSTPGAGSAVESQTRSKPGEARPGGSSTGDVKPDSVRPGNVPGEAQPGDSNSDSKGPPVASTGSPRAESSKDVSVQQGAPSQSQPSPERGAQPAPSASPDSKQSLDGPAAGNSAPSPSQATASRLQRAVAALREAQAKWQSNGNCDRPGSEPGSGTGASRQGSGKASEDGKPGSGSGSGGKGIQGANDANVEAEAANLARLKKRLAGRKWGELPGTLQTEILQAAQKKPNSEYAELIRQYFKEIAKTQPATTAPK